MSPPRPASLARAALPVVAVLVFVVTLGSIIVAAGDTLGYDFLAYYGAARRVLTGAGLYDLGYQRAGGFGLFLYPPTFLPLVLPLGLLAAGPATWAWTALMTAALVLAIGLLPVRPAVRWATLLLAGLDWPVVYTLKLGQVTPVLMLLSVLGWRAVAGRRPADRASSAGGPQGRPSERAGPSGAGVGRGLVRGADLVRGGDLVLGASAALGAALKLQPAVLLAWALLVGRWRAAVVGSLVLAALAAAVAAWLGLSVWYDYVALLRQITDPVTTTHNVTPGTVVHGLGLGVDASAAVQVLVMVAALAAVVLAARRALPQASYLVALCASQLISPVLWDHYAIMLLVPVAWLLDRGRWWAALVLLATSLPLVWLTPQAVYPVLFAVTLAAVLLEGWPRRQPFGSGGGATNAQVGPNPA